MLTDKPQTTREKWAAHKAEQRAERTAHRGEQAELNRTARTGRAGRRSMRFGGHGGLRRSRRTRGTSIYLERAVFNIATGRREPLPRTTPEAAA